MLNIRIFLRRNIVFLLLTFLTFGMLSGSARGASPDEIAHGTTGWYTFSNGLPPQKSLTWIDGVPESLSKGVTCFAGRPDQGTSCAYSDPLEGVGTQIALNYAPIYYLVIGAGIHLFASMFSSGLEFMGGRLFSAALNLITLFFTIRVIRRIRPSFEPLLILLSTPMSIFLWATMNPNGWEISLSMLLASKLAEITINAKTNIENATSNLESKSLLFLGIVFCLSRPISFVWFVLLLIWLCTIIGYHNIKKIRKSMVRFGLISTTPAFIYNITHPTNTGKPSADYVVPDHADLNYYFHAFHESIMRFNLHLSEMYGVLGWLDTSPPTIFTIFFCAGVAVLWLTIINSDKKKSLQALLFMFIVWPVCSLIETSAWTLWPYWWQGRYGLPILVGLLLVITIDSIKEKDSYLIFGFIFGMTSSGMVLFNLFRNAFGIVNFRPTSLSHSAFSHSHITIALIFIGLSIVTSLQLLKYEFIFRKERRLAQS